ncbi:putative sulfate/molybdate transporter [Methanofollis fontis]|uniref:Sulfate transporter n=1 Tax=Methanofollis fontis TaxID=2052832 RepID=A0A483CX06_9EURY|nr:putative sulfate/molybdate transporter [Methanofollis fontis]TAJ43567.1 sulfate transporter [Methanofollis fontis]
MEEAVEMEEKNRPLSLRFTIGEFAGSVGDFGTILPIVLGVALVCNVNLAHIFLFFALWYVVSGLIYRLPIPIEPLKAVGAIAIAEGLTAGEIAGAGLIIGVIFLGLGCCGSMTWLRDRIPVSVIRGVQAGLALVLIKTSIGFLISDPLFAGISVAVVVIFFIAALHWKINDVSALIVLAIGIGAGILTAGLPNLSMIPLPSLLLPSTADLVHAGLYLVPPQFPLTLTNAILATSLLAHDLFKTDVPPDRLSRTIGIMNLVSVPLGGFPMCHGAGGLAAQHRFGARTGGSNIIAGVIFLGFALFFASPESLALIPLGVFGGLLFFAAVELGKHSAKTDSYAVTIVIAVLSVLVNITVGFVVGLILAYLLRWQKREKAPE